MNIKRTLQRDGWLLTCEGDQILIARSEHSDWIEVRLADVHQLISDLREITEAARPRMSITEALAKLQVSDA